MMRISCSAAACMRDRREIDGMSGGGMGAADRSRAGVSMTDVRIRCVARPCSVSTTAIPIGAVERVADHLPAPPPHQPRQRFWKIVAKRVVLATGAIERPIVFGGNDRPGVMMASAVRTYLNRYGVAVRPAGRAVHNDGRWLEDRVRSGRAPASPCRGRRRSRERRFRHRCLLRRERPKCRCYRCAAQYSQAHGSQRD